MGLVREGGGGGGGSDRLLIERHRTIGGARGSLHSYQIKSGQHARSNVEIHNC